MLQRIEKVGVIGSGIMGGGIAALCASAKIPTILLDIAPFDLKEEEKKNPEAKNRIVQAGLDATIKAKPALFMNKKKDLQFIQIGNLTDDFKELSECDLIIEVIIEDLKIKQNLYKQIEEVRKPDAIIASNTSGLPLSKLIEGRSKEFKEHFLITHFFNPVRYMKLLEIVPGADTKKEIVNLISQWGEKTLGKGIVKAKDTPNFIVNRIGMALICDAIGIVKDENIAIPDFDAVFGPAFGMPRTAVFALADMVGLDTIGHLTKNSYDLLVNDERREVFDLPEYFSTMLKKNMFGNKTKETGGFYKSAVDPKTWKKKKLVLDIDTGEHIEFNRKEKPEISTKAKKAKSLPDRQKMILNGDNKLSQVAWQLASKVLIYSANRIPEIANSIVEIDNAMKWGFNLEAGPFETWDNLGLKESTQRMEKDGLKVPDKIKNMLNNGNETFYILENGIKKYYDFDSLTYKKIEQSDTVISLKSLKANNKVVKSNNSCSLIDLGDDVFCIEFNTKMNSLNDEILDFMKEGDEFIRLNGAGLVIGNESSEIPGAFSAGGDLNFMSALAKEKKWAEIDSFIADSQKTIQNARYSPYPVVSAPYGLTLGGGCEICLASDKIIAHSDLIMGLVEIGSGLLPAGGGCTNLWRRHVESLPDNVKISDYSPLFTSVIMTIAQAKMSMSASQAQSLGFLRPQDRIVFNRDYLIGEAKKEVLRMVDDGYHPPAKTKIPVMGTEAQGMIFAEMFNMASGGYIPPHMETISKKIAYVVSGGEARQGMMVTEDYMLKLEREAFIDLWKTENTQKMANHMLTAGKTLMI